MLVLTRAVPRRGVAGTGEFVKRARAAAALAPAQPVPAARAGGSLLIAAVLARPLPVPVIKRVTEPARRQNASKCHQQGNDKRSPQDHRVYRSGAAPGSGLPVSRVQCSVAK